MFREISEITGARETFGIREGEGGILVIEGEVAALDREYMGRACEAVMRRISGVAALSDAILEMKATREAEPKSASEETVDELARKLSGAGFPVSTGVLWGGAPEADAWLGAGEDGEIAEALRDLMEACPAWRVLAGEKRTT